MNTPSAYYGISAIDAMLLGLPEKPEPNVILTASEAVLWLIKRYGAGSIQMVRPVVDEVKKRVGTAGERQERVRLLQLLHKELPETLDEDAINLRDAVFAIARGECVCR